jgi:predicted ATPase
VGRESELEEVRSLLMQQGVRLLTLTGVGGVGKTRLATGVAREAAERFSEGAAFVGLAPLVDPTLVLPTIVRTLGLREVEGRAPGETLVDHLREKSLLLVLDNFEHLLEAAPEVAELIEACPNLVVVATSRAPLRVRGEREYLVPPLALPPSTRSPSKHDILGSPSVRLFLERARAVSPGFEIMGENVSSVAAVCWRLSGLPLALELAAAKSRLIDPVTLLSRLDTALSTAWARDLPERQRTMRATLDWSHDLLSKPERELFRYLSVFSGGFTLEAAEAVGAAGSVGGEDVLHLLATLVEQSLVVAGGDKVLGWALGFFWFTRGHHREGRRWMEAILERTLPPTLRARALQVGAAMAYMQGDFPVAEERYREALRLSRREGDELVEGYALAGTGLVEMARQDYEVAISSLEEAIALFERYGEDYLASFSRVFLGTTLLACGEAERAERTFEEGLASARRLKVPSLIYMMLYNLAQSALARGDRERAARLLREGIEWSERTRDKGQSSVLLGGLSGGDILGARDGALRSVARCGRSVAGGGRGACLQLL